MNPHRSQSKLNPASQRMKRFSALALAVALALSWFLTEEAALAADEKQIDMSELPMFVRMNPPPPNLMFIVDDSGSMNWDILIRGQPAGLFPMEAPVTLPGGVIKDRFSYVNYTGGSDATANDGRSRAMSPADRAYWKSQCFKYNALYYNPAVEYRPWPSYPGKNFSNADPDKPTNNPGITFPGTTNMNDWVCYGVGDVSITWGRYYVESADENRPYLVVLKSSGVRYYAVTVNGSGLHEKATALKQVNTPPADVAIPRSLEAERQNFANWFSYHRKRQFVAKYALGDMLTNLSGFRVGMYGLNKRVLKTLLPVKITQNNGTLDQSKELMEALYEIQPGLATPLKTALHMVGEYYKKNDGKLVHKKCQSEDDDSGECNWVESYIEGVKPYGDPGSGDCQQSFTVILTDGYYNDWTASWVGNEDGNNDKPYKDNAGGTLADTAMYYYENDLLPDLPNRVPTTAIDKVDHQHMSTYAVAFGVNGSLNPSDYDAALNHKTSGQAIVWPTVTGPSAVEAIDDLWHATVNGRGQFFSASNPQELNAAMKALLDAFNLVPNASSAPVATNGDKISTESFVYQPSYSNEHQEWKGDINAYRIDGSTGQISTHAWSAAAKLQSRNWDTGRVIATWDSEQKRGAKFRVDSLTNAQKSALGDNPTAIAAMVNYLRGMEVDGYRVRTTKLGDIVNSGPVHHSGVIYVGANDGMLHAFDATSGEEIFAYVPNLVFDKLKDLASPTYNHRFYVDLTPAVKKGVEITAGQSITLLVGGLRRGGKGYFGLNVTSAESIASEEMLKSRVLWEAPDASDPDMGYSFCKPIIVKTNSTTYPWVVIFGNGYNSVSEKAVLYILDPKDGFPIRKIEAHAGMDNGLSNTLVIDANYDEKADFVYAGDLQGNLWKFDLRDSDYTKWGVAFSQDGSPKPLYQAKGPGGSVQPITTKPDIMYHPEKQGFLVCFGTGKYFTESDFSDNSIQSIYGVWDYGDAVYDLRDKTWSTDDDTEFLGAFTRIDSAPLTNQPAKVGLLQQITADVDYTVGVNKYSLRLLTANKPVWKTAADATGQEPNPSAVETNHAGYYIDLPAGERVITNVIIRGGMLLALAFKPTVDACGSGGDSIFMEIDAFTGGRPKNAMFDINRDNKVDASDMVTVTLSNGTTVTVPPVGIKFGGFVETPAIMRLGPTNVAGIEMKYFSSSDGGIHTLAERAPKLGLTHWMEVRH